MPLHGKIVVIKRSGGDGTEFPLTASCLFGRKPDCDIRIQLPQVSKEHCKIEFNENKEVILTNLSSVNPTRVNGEVLQQSERLKHGDLITIIDRSFRFEYPPAPTPKKRRSSTSGKCETLQVLQDKQTRDTGTVLSGEKRILELTTDSCLKDETNSEKFQRPLEQTVVVEPKEAESLEQNKTGSPFCELYQMIKQNLDSKTPWKQLGSQPQTPVSTSLCTPKAVFVKKLAGNADSKAKNTPKKTAITTSGQTAAEGSTEVASESITPKPVGKQRKSLEVASEKIISPEDDKKVEQTAPELATLVQETPKNKWRTSKTQTPLAAEHGSTPDSEKKVTPQRFTVSEVIEQITGCLSAEKPKTPTKRRSSSTEETLIQPASTQGQDGGSVAPEQVEDHAEAQLATPKPQPQPSCSPRTSPRTVARKMQVQDVLCKLEVAAPTSAKQNKRKSKDFETKLPTPKMKRKRVSFGGNLSPELFDKRLPSDSPLRKGAAPRRSLCVPKQKESLLRRASVIGLLTEFEETGPTSPKGNKSPKRSKTPSPKRTHVKAKTPSPKKTPVKAKTPSPEKTPVVKTKQKSPVSKAKTPSPAKSQPIATPISKKSPSPRRQSKITAVAAETALSLDSTPTVKGRFSVSRVDTPSPTADQEAGTVQQTAGTATPHMTPRRKSMKSTAKKTPKKAMQSAVNVLRRRSGVSRASMKMNSWADIVKFGQTKSKVVVPAKKTSTREKEKKAVVAKPKTPARKPNIRSMAEYTSTGHAESPVTIVVGKAHKRLIQAVCAAPKVVPNIAVLKKNMKMDEDLSGVAEIFSTPVSDRQTQSVCCKPNAINTPMRSQSTGMNETWGLDTPEETGEMVVSPLSVDSTAKRGRYSSEAVSRFLQEDQEASFIGQMSPAEEYPSRDVLIVDMCSDNSGQLQRPDTTTEASTPKRKPEEPDCLTGVKRMMKTPRQKVAPVEDLRGKLLKTPRQQKPKQGECLTGVKRIMKTPKQKAAPVEDLRGKLLNTPREHKVSGEACLDGVKELLQTPECKDKLPQQQQAEEPKGTCEEQQAEDVGCVEASLDAEANRMTEEADVPCVESLEGESKFKNEASPDVSSEPAASDEQAVVTCVEPAEAVPCVEPAEAVPCVEPAEDVSCVEPAEDVACVEPAEAVACVEPAEAVPCVEPAEAVPCVEPAEAVPCVEPAEGVPCVEPAEAVPCVEPAEGVASVEPAEGVASVEPAAAVACVEPAEVVACVEPAEDVSCVEPAEFVSCVEPAEAVPCVEPAEAVPCVEPAEAVACVEPAEDVSCGEPAEEDQEAQPEGVLCVEKESPPAAVPDITEDSDLSSVEHQPEDNTKVEESTCDVTEVEMTSVVPVSLKKSSRGRKAQTSDHPGAPVLSARGRREQKPKAVVVEAPAEPSLEDAIQQPAALKPRRGRKPGQENLQEPAKEESPPQDNVGSDESTAVAVVEKPKRGRKTKQASVEQPEVVVESTAQALGKSIPAAEKEPQVPVKARRGRIANQDSEDKVKVVAVEIPAVETAGAKEPLVKPRRGRKAKQDSKEQPNMEEKKSTPGPEKAESPTPVSKPMRGKKVGKQQQQSVEQVESAEEKPVEPVQLEAPAETVEVVEAPAEKPKRGGRKSKPVPESVPAPETTAPRRGRRGTKQENELTLTTEAAAAAGENESKEEEAIGDVPACGSSHAGHVSVPAEEAVVKTVRGRKVKLAFKEEEVPRATPAKRGRRGASVPETAAAPEAAALTPARSGARGRAAKPVIAKEVAAEPVEVPPEPVKRGRRAAKSTNALTEEVSPPAPAAESTSEEPDAEVAPVEVKRGRGKAQRKVQAVATVTNGLASEAGVVTEPLAKETKKSTKSVNWIANFEVEQQTNASPVVKAVRGKRAKIVVVEHDVSQAAAAVATKKSRRTKVESTAPEVTASKPVNKRKAASTKGKEDQNIETDVDVPVKRGRKGAIAPEAVASSEDLAESIPEGCEPAPAKGKGRVPRKGKAVSKALETDQADETEEQPKVRRGRTAGVKK